MIKIDLHTHSVGSPDGGITLEEYARLLDDKVLDMIAVTDHDSIEQALAIQNKLGPRIIIGEEITSLEGEIIGLFLSQKVEPGLSALQTVQAIKSQGGLVYIPHPFETVRKGVTQAAIDSISDEIDIVEVYNGRAVFQNKGPQALTWARLNNKIGAASSDAHGLKGVGTTYSSVETVPVKESFLEVLKTARLTTKRPPLLSLFYPKYNRFRAKIKK
jgi:predicted metal-dependent phosphoesterase TrpH